MADKEYVCTYKYSLYHGEKVKDSESVVINKKYYHWDCAAMKQEILKILNSITLINQCRYCMGLESYFGRKNIRHRW